MVVFEGLTTTNQPTVIKIRTFIVRINPTPPSWFSEVKRGPISIPRFYLNLLGNGGLKIRWVRLQKHLYFFERSPLPNGKAFESPRKKKDAVAGIVRVRLYQKLCAPTLCLRARPSIAAVWPTLAWSNHQRVKARRSQNPVGSVTLGVPWVRFQSPCSFQAKNPDTIK